MTGVKWSLRGVFGLLLCLGMFGPVQAADIQVQREVLPNGLVLQVVSRPALPIVTVELAVRAGADRDAKAGTANLVAALLTEGTETRDAGDIAEAIEFVGGSLSASADRDYASVGLSVLSRDLPMGMDVLADVVRHPAFVEAELERVRAEVQSAIKADEDNPRRVAAKAFNAELFADHPYGRPVEGDADSVATITRTDLSDFHHDYYRPNNAILSLVGDVTLAQARKLAITALGDWQTQPVTVLEAVTVTAPTATRLVTVDRSLAQANVVMGHLGLRRDNPDFYPVLVMNYILGGGGFTSRVVKSVRDDQGLAYSIYTGFDAKRSSGSFSVVFQTQNSNTNQAIDSVLKELSRIRQEPVSEQELDEAKSYLSGSFPLRLDTNRKTAHLLTFIEIHGLGLGYFDDYVAHIRAVTPEAVSRVAKDYLDPQNMIWVVVGNQEEAAVVVP